MDNKFNELFEVFFSESIEMLDNMEQCLLELEKKSSDMESIQKLFRAVHTIKGSSGMFGFTIIMNFTHIVENILDDLREEKIIIDSNLISLLLKCHDFILEIINLYRNDAEAELTDILQNEYDALTNELNKFSQVEINITEESTFKKENKTFLNVLKEYNYKVQNECWHISIRFHESLFKFGIEPKSVINYLNKIGQIVKIFFIKDNIPPLRKLNPENCYFGLEISFLGNVTKEKLEEVFEFIIEDSVVNILPPESNIEIYLNLIHDLGEEPVQIGEILKNIGALTEKELNDILKLQKQNKEKLFGEIAVEEKIIKKQVVEAAVEKQNINKNLDRKISESIKVKTFKLDDLINQVGELVISLANVNQHAKKYLDEGLQDSLSIFNQHVNVLMDNAMKIRMMPVGDSFIRFERVVRDLSRNTNKKINFHIKGGETELDKTLIEKVTDPIMHLVRNSIDHGIDYPEERVKKGKPEVGNITINAFQDKGSIIIEVIDDGNGLNKSKILEKAIENKIISKDMSLKLSDDDIYQIIFEHGFSTASSITDISGRGVGMDVVKKNISDLRGKINIKSKDGEGTKMQISIPLTLAIINGFWLTVGNMNLIIPTDIIIECIKYSAISQSSSGNLFFYRGEMIPYINLNDFFDEENFENKIKNIVIVELFSQKIGLIVNDLKSELQVVIKPLNKLFNKISYINGVTILGNGQIAFIFDIFGLKKFITTYCKA